MKDAVSFQEFPKGGHHQSSAMQCVSRKLEQVEKDERDEMTGTDKHDA